MCVSVEEWGALVHDVQLASRKMDLLQRKRKWAEKRTSHLLSALLSAMSGWFHLDAAPQKNVSRAFSTSTCAFGSAGDDFQPGSQTRVATLQRPKWRAPENVGKREKAICHMKSVACTLFLVVHAANKKNKNT